MADNVVLNAGSGGATLATDDVGGTHYQIVKLALGALDAATLLGPTNPLPVDAQGLTAATTSLATSSALAAGSQVDLDSAQVTVSTTAKLVALFVNSSVPIKAVLKTLLNGAASSDLAVFFIQPNGAQLIVMPSKEFFTQVHDAGVGLDGFRVTVTNLDTSQPSDVYCTFLYDEV